MNQYFMIAAVALLGILLLLYVAYKVFGRRDEPEEMDLLEGHDFESYCAQLLRTAGFLDVELTPASRDFGADILTEKDGITYAIQCKRYQGPVGVEAVQQVYAAKDYYDCIAAVVMTNQYFTAPAVELATKLKVLLWDRGYLEQLLEEDMQ